MTMITQYFIKKYTQHIHLISVLNFISYNTHNAMFPEYKRAARPLK